MSNTETQIADHTFNAATTVKGKMTPGAQRIAIAVACGWTRFVKKSNILAIEKTMWFPPNEKRRELQFTTFIPNYLLDLNAIHEAEKVLNPTQRLIYSEWLIEITKDRHPSIALWRNTHATAAQRAEAFLKTLDLWDETK